MAHGVFEDVVFWGGGKICLAYEKGKTGRKSKNSTRWAQKPAINGATWALQMTEKFMGDWGKMTPISGFMGPYLQLVGAHLVSFNVFIYIFTPILGEMIQFDENVVQLGWCFHLARNSYRSHLLHENMLGGVRHSRYTNPRYTSEHLRQVHLKVTYLQTRIVFKLPIFVFQSLIFQNVPHFINAI